jgi:hypothetical protein
VARQPAAGDEGEQERHPDPDPPGVGADQGAVAGDQLLFGTRRPEARGDPVGDDHVDQDEDEEDGGEHHRREGLGDDQVTPDVLEAELLEEQVVGVEPGDPAEADEQQQDDAGQPGQEDLPVYSRTAPAATTGTAGLWFGNPHAQAL